MAAAGAGSGAPPGAGAEALAAAGLASPGGARSVLGALVSPRTWLAVIHLLAGLVIGIVSFTVVVTGISLGIALLPVFLVGIAVLVAVIWLAGLFARAERADRVAQAEPPLPGPLDVAAFGVRTGQVAAERDRGDRGQLRLGDRARPARAARLQRGAAGRQCPPGLVRAEQRGVGGPGGGHGGGAAAGRATPDPGRGGGRRGGGQVAAGPGQARRDGSQDRRAGDQPGPGGRRRRDRTPPDRAGSA